jgi:hypothetical protein
MSWNLPDYGDGTGQENAPERDERAAIEEAMNDQTIAHDGGDDLAYQAARLEHNAQGPEHKEWCAGPSAHTEPEWPAGIPTFAETKHQPEL